MVFKFDLGDVKDSFEEYVARRLVNDNGESVQFEVAYIIVQEFRKLMFINAIEILLSKKKGNMDWRLNTKLGKRGWSFHPFMPAAYYVDLVW